MTQVYVSKETRTLLNKKKAELEAKSINDVIEYLLYKRNKDGKA